MTRTGSRPGQVDQLHALETEHPCESKARVEFSRGHTDPGCGGGQGAFRTTNVRPALQEGRRFGTVPGAP